MTEEEEEIAKIIQFKFNEFRDEHTQKLADIQQSLLRYYISKWN